MSLRRKRILLTGGSGFIGSHLCEKLIIEDNELTLLTLENDSLNNLSAINDQLNIISSDLNNLENLKKIVKDAAPQYVFHLAANTNQSRHLNILPFMIENNLRPTVNLILAAAEISLARFIVIGTSDIYGQNPVPYREDMPLDPISPYAATKAASLLFSRFAYRNCGLPIVMLIPFMVYGPRQNSQMLISQAIVSALKGEDFPMTLGEQIREFNYVGDIVEGLIKAAEISNIEGEIINLCGGEKLTAYEAVQKIMSLLGNKVKILRGALPYRELEVMAHYGEAAKAKKLLNYFPKTSFLQGLETTIAYFRNQVIRD